MAVVRYMIQFQEFYEALNNNLCAVTGKEKGNDQELVQSNPTSHPQNQKGKKDTYKTVVCVYFCRVDAFGVKTRESSAIVPGKSDVSPKVPKGRLFIVCPVRCDL